MAEYLDDFEDMEDDFEYGGQPCDWHMWLLLLQSCLLPWSKQTHQCKFE